MKKYRVIFFIIVCTISLISIFYKIRIVEKIGLLGHENVVDKNKSYQEQIKKIVIQNTDNPVPVEKSENIAVPVEPIAKHKQVKEIDGLVSVHDIDNSILIDLKYATTDNFTGKVIYPIVVCLLQKETVQKLVKANDEFNKSGYNIKIWDAYRPVYVQQIFWNIVKDSRFVANPANGGSVHNRGTAVDVTLVDSNGKELEMPSKFDDFSSNAYRDNTKIDVEAKKNMDYLTDVMKKNGFNTIDTEWWHYEDSDFSKYKIVDINLEQFMK